MWSAALDLAKAFSPTPIRREDQKQVALPRDGQQCTFMTVSQIIASVSHHSPQSNQQHPDVLQTTTLAYRSDDTVLSGICDVFVRYAGSTEWEINPTKIQSPSGSFWVQFSGAFRHIRATCTSYYWKGETQCVMGPFELCGEHCSYSGTLLTDLSNDFEGFHFWIAPRVRKGSVAGINHKSPDIWTTP